MRDEMTNPLLYDPTWRNEERARRVAAALMHYRHVDDAPGHWMDFLADFMHFCKREGVDFQELLRTSKMHFNAEMNGEP